ncbi:hypothetical protein [Aquisphaera insulae]|uniref:hypothetical protein n=1 Tax=Aquisphaera insulae TaxID=2712864 RepID=UPI0013EC65BC|nr:hypothetical protein [Aquisphaera insulae]
MDDRTAAALEGIITTAFIGTWIVLAIVGFIASRRMSAAAKRRWAPREAILVGVLFVFFSTTMTVLQSRSWSSMSFLVLVVPAVVLISYLNIKFTKFCDKCNATLYNHNWFQPMRFCSKCGAEHDPVKPSQGDSLLE